MDCDAWSIQIFSTTDPAGFGPARAMLEVALLGEHQHVVESGDGLRSYLIVETRDDPTLMRSVRLAVETVGIDARLDQVHGSGADRRDATAVPRPTGERAA
ncbi:hypothetical protein ACHAAC_13760 [Aeromicrobium sp. CF4.19]|uniref:hypothetical protein n=1 Tax=Aeromicrobium sp. CF4.19 TaxID=3373082 RepID=UPI003EE4B76E